ncbi:uncharacterized protein EI90DRAFT_2423106 [Cantharellus anzutake]|uniref:uncharacterized protein n=1 Tax=Cantharellus anzutake TaxID=1750568 RepID=UPI0019032F4F|nr:uncharacterized protein EI90DRAFT_2423106 [Cantharellus anzutake]KAF8338854.1 hypothetical protein EI90DRAFT_2423106 [Cantharellus anzutake]
MFSRRNKGIRPARGPSPQPPHPQAHSESHVPQVRVTDAQISPDHDNYRRDQLGVPAGSYPEPEVAAQIVPSGDRSDRKKPAFLMRILQKLNPVRSKPSTAEPLGPSRPTTPFLQPSGDDAVPPPSPRTPTAHVNNPRESSGTHATPDNRLNIYAQLEREDVIIPFVSEPTTMPSANSGSDRKKVIIGATRLVLQNAADALKFAPIANLDAIPNLLLTWLQVYETVGGNDDELEGLGDHIRKAYTTILQPLELSTDQIPPEVIQFINGFQSALKGQINEIELLKTRNLATKVFLAAEIANRISGVKMCINEALNSFSTQATILTLLRTIEASVES